MRPKQVDKRSEYCRVIRAAASLSTRALHILSRHTLSLALLGVEKIGPVNGNESHVFPRRDTRPTGTRHLDSRLSNSTHAIWPEPRANRQLRCPNWPMKTWFHVPDAGAKSTVHSLTAYRPCVCDARAQHAHTNLMRVRYKTRPTSHHEGTLADRSGK